MTLTEGLQLIAHIRALVKNARDGDVIPLRWTFRAFGRQWTLWGNLESRG